MLLSSPVEWSGIVWHRVRDVNYVKMRACLFLLAVGLQMGVVAQRNAVTEVGLGECFEHVTCRFLSSSLCNL